MAELVEKHEVPPRVLRRWRQVTLLPLQRMAQGEPSPMAKMRKELRHLTCELKNSQRDPAFFVQAFGELDLLSAKC